MKNNSIRRSLSVIHIAICFSIGLIFIFGSAIFVALTFYGESIDSKIQELSILRDYQQPLWGKQPNARGATNTLSITPYNISVQSGQFSSKLTNSTATLDYSFQYKNVTFSQGNSGNIKLLNNWRLLNPGYAEEVVSQNISTLNLAAQKIFSNDYYAPMARRFVLLYNDLNNNLESVFIHKFYAKYLYEYYFKDQALVYKSIFKRLGISENDFNNIYNNSLCGMNDPQKLQSWTRIVLAENPYDSVSYFKVRKTFQFSHQMMMKIIGKQSVFGHLIQALNGTIQNKFSGQRTFDCPCQKNICSNSQLIAGELATSILLGSAIFPSLSLDSSLMQFNKTLPHQLQYNTFCKNNPDLNCLDSQNLILFFRRNIFTSFPISFFLAENKEKINYIEKQLDLVEGTGLSIVKYFEHVYSIFSQQQNSTSFYQNDEKLYWSITNYQYHTRSINLLEETIIVQLYSRAFFNKYITTDKHKCQQYFTGDLAKYQKSFCESKDYNFSSLQAIRTFLQIYLQVRDSNKIKNQTNIAQEDLYALLYQQNNLFASQMKQLQSGMAKFYNCSQIICSKIELLSLQWGSNSILSNLPTPYFAQKSATLPSWDEKGIFNGKNVQYWSIANEKINKEQSIKMLSIDSEISITNLFSVMNIFQKGQKKILAYIQKVVLDVFFQGIIIQKSLEKLIQGSEQQALRQKVQRPVTEGGTPWLSKNVSFISMNNKQRIQYTKFADLFDQINTGIYCQDSTRKINKIQGLKISSSLYTVYRPTQKIDDKSIFIRLKTNKQINGNTIYGFHPNLLENQNLKMYLPFAYQSLVLIYSDSMQYPDSSSSIYGLKYVIENLDFINNSIEQQNNRQIKISPQSYLIADQKTGLTLEFKIKFTIYSTPKYGTFIVNSSKVPILDASFNYKQNNLDKIQQVYNVNYSMNVFIFVFIGLAVLCMIIIVALTILYFVKRRKVNIKKQSLIENTQPGTQSAVI